MIKKETIIRTIVLAVALVNQGLTLAGKTPLPFTNEEVGEIVAYVFTIGASLWAWWKNNSFTKPAIEADEVLEELRNK